MWLHYAVIHMRIYLYSRAYVEWRSWPPNRTTNSPLLTDIFLYPSIHSSIHPSVAGLIIITPPINPSITRLYKKGRESDAALHSPLDSLTIKNKNSVQRSPFRVWIPFHSFIKLNTSGAELTELWVKSENNEGMESSHFISFSRNSDPTVNQARPKHHITWTQGGAVCTTENEIRKEFIFNSSISLRTRFSGGRGRNTG